MSLLLLIPAWWLAVVALDLALCRAAAQGDAAVARLWEEQPVTADLDNPLGHITRRRARCSTTWAGDRSPSRSAPKTARRSPSSQRAAQGAGTSPGVPAPGGSLARPIPRASR